MPANLTRRYTDQQYDIWSGPLSSDRIVVALVNWANTTRTLTLSLASDLNLASITSLHNIWSNTTHTSIKDTYTSPVPAHGTLLLILTSPLPLPPTWRGPSTYHPAPLFTLSGTANLTTCPPSTLPPLPLQDLRPLTQRHRHPDHPINPRPSKAVCRNNIHQQRHRVQFLLDQRDEFKERDDCGQWEGEG